MPSDAWKATATVPVSGDELLHGGEAVVEPVERGADVAVEHGSGRGECQQAPRALEELGADLLLEARERARDAGLRTHLEFGDLGDGRAVGDHLEPAQRFGVHPTSRNP